MYRLSQLMNREWPQAEHARGVWFPARPENEDYRPLRERVREAWAVFRGRASAFTWD